jgi:hypothetical protein
VWIARLDEIAAWWRKRTEATIRVSDVSEDQLGLAVTGPRGITVLARAVQVDAPITAWADGYQQVEATTFMIRCPVRPLIGLSPASSPRLADFMQQQGYLIEISPARHRYSYYFDEADFTSEKERPLLDHIEQTNHPLVRLGRWPNGARSALAITGDIDALTLWDYGARLAGR